MAYTVITLLELQEERLYHEQEGEKQAVTNAMKTLLVSTVNIKYRWLPNPDAHPHSSMFQVEPLRTCYTNGRTDMIS
jgi:hypothetical protein